MFAAVIESYTSIMKSLPLTTSLLCLPVLLGIFHSSVIGAPSPAPKAGISSQFFGECPEGSVTLYTLTNTNGMSVSITDFGATVVKIITPDRHGRLADIAIGFENPSAYASAPLNFGTMGRYVNRLGKGEVTLDGTTYHLTKNKGTYTMHGGKLGFNRHLWKGRVLENNPPTLRMTRLSPDGEEGFPGNLHVSATFTLTEDNRLRIHYSATTDKPTVVNISNHTLFNLSGQGRGDILGHIATVNADAWTPTEAAAPIPTGEIRPIDGGPLDLRKPTVLRKHINEIGNKPPGYDLNYVQRKDGKSSWSEACEVYDPRSGRFLKFFSNQPGLQFYTGNMFDGTLIGKGGVKYKQHCAFCLEAQHYSDSPHHSNFPSTVLRPGETYSATIEYCFGIR